MSLTQVNFQTAQISQTMVKILRVTSPLFNSVFDRVKNQNGVPEESFLRRFVTTIPIGQVIKNAFSFQSKSSFEHIEHVPTLGSALTSNVTSHFLSILLSYRTPNVLPILY